MYSALITGASGLIGSHIAEYFTGERLRIACLVRKNSRTEFLETLNVEIKYGDITDIDSLTKAFTETDFIIHTAAKVSDWGRFADFYKTNVTGTLNVLKAAVHCGIKNVIITGSISCYGEESSTQIKNEDGVYDSHYKYFLDRVFPSGMNYYRDTKAEANKQAIQYAKENNLNLTIIDPAWIYGEREFHSGFYEFLKSIRSGLRFVPGSKKNKFHTIYAKDLAKIYYLAYRKKLVGINQMLAVAPRAEYQHKIFDSFCREAGYKIPYRIPKFLIYPFALFAELFYKTFPIKNPPPISRARVNIFYDNIEYSDKKLKNLLGFTPDYSFEESIRKTVSWYKKNNYL
ncbi:MAG: NAD-dependent epimerase/dehydratase family protein [Bacteroidota bacterium]